jgi:hypothetical protein
LLRQLGNCQLHGTLDWNASDTFVFVHPTISSQGLVGFLTQGLQIFDALFSSRFFIITTALRGTDHSEHDYTEERKEQHDPKPHGEWSARMSNLTKRFGVGHVS